MKKSLMLALGLTLGLAAVGSAQTPSAADSVWLTVEGNEADTGVTDGAFAVNIWVTISAQINGGTLGFSWDDKTDWQYDSAVFGPAISAWSLATATSPTIANDSGKFLIGGAAFAGQETNPGSGILWATVYFSEKVGSGWTAGSSTKFDSAFVAPGGDFLLTRSDNSQIIPTFLGAIFVTFNDVLDDGSGALPTEYELAQNYPNPFNPDTKIEFAVPKRSEVKLEVFNILGQKVRTLINGEMDAAYHSVIWEGNNDAGSKVSSGVYFYKLTAGDVVKTRKMMLMK